MREIAHALEQPPGDARGAARAARDLVGAVLRHRNAEDARAAVHDQLQLLARIEIEPHRNAEAVTQWRGEQARPRRCTNQGEARQIDLHRPRRRPLANDQIELKVLHGGIENFLDRWIEPVDLIDEQNVAVFEIGQQRGEVAGLGDDRAGGRAKVHSELARNDLRQRGLAKAGRADEQHVVERFLARARRLDEHREVGARLRLADELGEPLRAQRGLRVVVAALGCDEAWAGAHVIPRRYLFGSNSPMVTIVAPSLPGTMIRALPS